MKKFISTLLLSTCLLTVSIFAGDTPHMGITDTGTECVHGDSYVGQVVCYFLGD